MGKKSNSHQDKLRTGASTDAYRDNYDKIFGKKKTGRGDSSPAAKASGDAPSKAD